MFLEEDVMTYRSTNISGGPLEDTLQAALFDDSRPPVRFKSNREAFGTDWGSIECTVDLMERGDAYENSDNCWRIEGRILSIEGWHGGDYYDQCGWPKDTPKFVRYRATYSPANERGYMQWITTEGITPERTTGFYPEKRKSLA